MLDIHTHILPGIDDGSQSVRQSIAMLRMEASQGVNRVALTPHFYAGRNSPERFFASRAEATEQLRRGLAGETGIPRMHLGAEVEYFDGMGRADGIDAFCIGGTQAMLIEMPFCRWNANMIGELTYLRQCRGIQPIIAHVERYMGYQPHGAVSYLCDSGFWIQTNASFFLGWRTKLLATAMLKKRQIHFVGSDCHGVTKRPPALGEALAEIEAKLGKGALEYLTFMESRLLEG